MNNLTNFFNFLNVELDASIVFLTVMSFLVVLVVWSWHRDKSIDFHLQQVLVDSVTGKISIEKVGFMTALAISTWGFVALTIQGKMSEWYAGLYMSAFVLARTGSAWMSVKKDLTQNQNNTPPQ